MAEIDFAGDWNGTSTNFKGTKTWKNHESSLSKEEMKALVLDILKIPGMDDPEDEKRHAKFKRLTKVLKGEEEGSKIVVVKGIHQRDGSAVHFTLRIAPTGMGEGSYHVFLASGGTTTVTTKPSSGGSTVSYDMFSYKISGVTYEAKATGNLNYPAAFKQVGLDVKHRQRGTSFSTGNSTPILGGPPSWAHMDEFDSIVKL